MCNLDAKLPPGSVSKIVASCELRLNNDDQWVAMVKQDDRKGHEAIGRGASRSEAIARALRTCRLRYASAKDEEGIAIAAFRNAPVKLLAKDNLIHYLGLG